MAITFVIDNVDRDLCYLLGNGACRRECSPKVGEYLAPLSDQISRPDQLPIHIFRFLANDEYELGAGRYDDLGIGCRGRGILRVDAYLRPWSLPRYRTLVSLCGAGDERKATISRIAETNIRPD